MSAALLTAGAAIVMFLIGLLFPSPLMRAQQRLYEAQARQTDVATEKQLEELHTNHMENASKLDDHERRIAKLEAFVTAGVIDAGRDAQ